MQSIQSSSSMTPASPHQLSSYRLVHTLSPPSCSPLHLSCLHTASPLTDLSQGHPPPSVDSFLRSALFPAPTSILPGRMEFKRTKQRRATGPDAISFRLRRRTADQLSELIQNMYDLSLSLDKAQFLWSSAVVASAVCYTTVLLSNSSLVAITLQLMFWSTAVKRLPLSSRH